MTIFDSIKYPISDLPTVAELSALPVDLYGEWLISSGWGGRKRHHPHHQLSVCLT